MKASVGFAAAAILVAVAGAGHLRVVPEGRKDVQGVVDSVKSAVGVAKSLKESAEGAIKGASNDKAAEPPQERGVAPDAQEKVGMKAEEKVSKGQEGGLAGRKDVQGAVDSVKDAVGVAKSLKEGAEGAEDKAAKKWQQVKDWSKEKSVKEDVQGAVDSVKGTGGGVIKRPKESAEARNVERGAVADAREKVGMKAEEQVPKPQEKGVAGRKDVQGAVDSVKGAVGVAKSLKKSFEGAIKGASNDKAAKPPKEHVANADAQENVGMKVEEKVSKPQEKGLAGRKDVQGAVDSVKGAVGVAKSFKESFEGAIKGASNDKAAKPPQERGAAADAREKVGMKAEEKVPKPQETGVAGRKDVQGAMDSVKAAMDTVKGAVR